MRTCTRRLATTIPTRVIRCSICSMAPVKTSAAGPGRGARTSSSIISIAAGKAKPMIIVMENGGGSALFANRGEPGANAAAGRGRGNAASSQFAEILIRETMPMIEANYRTLTDRSNRAIAGLSMGAGQAWQIGTANLDKFSYHRWIQRRRDRRAADGLQRRDGRCESVQQTDESALHQHRDRGERARRAYVPPETGCSTASSTCTTNRRARHTSGRPGAAACTALPPLLFR